MSYLPFTPETIDFLWGIRFNNNRDWFQQNKKTYTEKLYRPMQSLAEEVRERFSLPDTVLKTARIYRDVRFSGGIPYKEHLWFVVRRDEGFWSEHPSVFFQIDPEGGLLGFAYYSPAAAVMQAYRDRLGVHPAEMKNMMDPLLAAGCTDMSARYKREKPGGSADNREWYQMKNCLIARRIEPGPELFSEKLPENIALWFSRFAPLYNYFTALEASVTAPAL